MANPHHNIGVQNESTLHRDLKALVSQDGDRFEVRQGEFTIDIMRGDTCIEIQTSGLAAMGRKLDHLLSDFHVHIVHPVAAGTWIHRRDMPVRKSPKRGSVYDVFGELARVPTMLDHPNLTIEVFVVDVDSVRVHDPKLRRRRGGWRTVDKRLRGVVARHGFRSPSDLAALLPAGLPEGWTTADLAGAAGIHRRVAQQMAYVLKANELVTELGRDRAGVHYGAPVGAEHV